MTAQPVDPRPHRAISQAPPATIVIFGASGDLTHRRLAPARHSLACAGRLSAATRIPGIERLLLDGLSGDPSLFLRSDEIERSREIVDPLLRSKIEPFQYEEGSWGPSEAASLLRNPERRWLDECHEVEGK